MDFSAIFQLRTKKFWWMDVIFYFAISLLIATILCYFIFLIKNSFIRDDIKKEIAALETVGTQQQKEYEENVIVYQNKISDFSDLLKNYEFASNVFAFVQEQTRSNVWFKQFVLDKKNNAVQLSGESDDMDTFSRQIATFENEDNKRYVKSVGTLNSSIGQASRIDFNINLVLNQNIFSYLLTKPSVFAAVTPIEEQLPAEQGQTTAGAALSSEKRIISFRLPLNPEVAGLIDENNHVITLNVPYGTDVKNMMPSIIVSPEATISPVPNISQNFTNPVIYKVTAQDNSVQNYEARVIIAVQPVAKKSGLSIFIILIIIAGIIIAAAITFLFFWRRIKTKNKP